MKFKLTPYDAKRRYQEAKMGEAELKDMSVRERVHARRVHAEELRRKKMESMEKKDGGEKPKKSGKLFWIILIVIAAAYVYLKYFRK